MSKKIFGIKFGGETVLLRIDTETKITEYSLDGSTWAQTMLADATAETSGLMSATDKTKLDNLLIGYKGYYATSEALISAHPTGSDGDFASIGATDTLWAWDSDTSAWVNTNSTTINPTWDSILDKPDLAPAFEPSFEIWIDSNFNGEVSDGTINKPFKTFSEAVAIIASDCTIHFSPGTYTESSSIAMPSYACSIYGNRASLTITGNFTVYIGSEMRGLSLNVSGVFSSASCYYENCDITAGSIVSIGQMRINFCQVIGDITVNATKGFDANLSEITGRIIANGDSCRIVDCVIQCDSASPAIYSTAGYLIVMGAVIYNTGGGGDISCDNGATTLPNIITNVYCYTGGIACGDAVTVTNGSVTVLTTFTGTAIRSGKTLMALGSDTTGDIYCRGSDGFLTRIASPETGKFLGGNGVGTAPTFLSVPWGSVSDKVLATSEVDGLLSSTGYAKLSNVTVGYLGYYATEATLIAAHATGSDGQFATIGETDTIWAWDSDTSTWKNTGSGSITPTWASITGKPSWVPTKIYYVDGNRSDTYTEDGSTIYPFKTIGAATAVADSGSEIKVVPATYTENVTLPNGVSISGFTSNKSIISGTLTTTASTNMAIRNIQCSGTVTLNAPVSITGCYFTGAVIVENVVTQIYDTYIICGTEGIVPITINGSSAKYQHFLSTISATGNTKCVILNNGTAIFDVCQFTNTGTTTSVIEALDGQLIVLNSWVVNNGGGGAISADNGAEATLPNALGNIFVVGSCIFGSANTVVEGIRSLYGILTLTGTALLYRGASQISVDTSGFAGNLSAADTDVQKALEIVDGLEISDIPSSSEISSSAMGFPQIPTGYEAVTSGGLAKWLLNNSLADSFGSYTLTNYGVTFSEDANYPFGTSYVGVFSGSTYATFDPTGLPSGGAARTICMRIKTTQSDVGNIVGYGDTSSFGQLFSPMAYYGKLGVAGGGEAYTIDSGIAVNDGNWHSCVITLASDGKNVGFNVDGTTASGSVTTAYNTVLTVGSIGQCGTAGLQYFTGSIADVRIYNRVLTATEQDSYIHGEASQWEAPASSSDALVGTEQIVYRDPNDAKPYYKSITSALATTSAPGFMSATDKTKLDGLSNEVVASSETTVTTTYTANYSTATIHRIATTSSTTCALTIQNIPQGKALVIRVNNAAAGSVTFDSTEVVSSASTGITFLTFVNITGTIEWVE